MLKAVCLSLVNFLWFFMWISLATLKFGCKIRQLVLYKYVVILWVFWHHPNWKQFECKAMIQAHFWFMKGRLASKTISCSVWLWIQTAEALHSEQVILIELWGHDTCYSLCRSIRVLPWCWCIWLKNRLYFEKNQDLIQSYFPLQQHLVIKEMSINYIMH